MNEADEFNHNFWHYHPRLAIVKAIEYEHPEFFPDYEAFLGAFEHFVRGMDMQGDWPLPPTLIVNADSPGCLELLARLHDWSGKVVTYSLEGSSLLAEPAAFEAYDVQFAGETSFRVRTRTTVAWPEQRVVRLQLPGAHNVENALAALAAAHTLGVDAETIAQTLEGFTGIRRRFELRQQGPLLVQGKVLDVMLIDDYAHHPTAIAATLEATRRRYPAQRLIAVYQPHMYSRTKTFFAQFLQAFDVADVVMIADIFPARERDTGLVHARDLVAALAQRPHFAQDGAQIMHSGSVESTTLLLSQILHSGDLVVIMGAGDIYNVTELLLQNARQA